MLLPIINVNFAVLIVHFMGLLIRMIIVKYIQLQMLYSDELIPLNYCLNRSNNYPTGHIFLKIFCKSRDD